MEHIEVSGPEESKEEMPVLAWRHILKVHSFHSRRFIANVSGVKKTVISPQLFTPQRACVH